MTSETEVKLLTLLNVSAIKRPREMDLPRGHRGSPSASPSPLNTVYNPRRGMDEEIRVKRRKSVVFGGILGPSGKSPTKSISSQSAVNGKQIRGKGVSNVKHTEGSVTNGNGHDHPNSDSSFSELIDEDTDEQDDKAESSSGEVKLRIATELLLMYYL